MEQYVVGGVSIAISQHNTPNQKENTKNCKLKESCQLSTLEKKFQFSRNEEENNHIKYKITPYSTKIIYEKKNEPEENKTGTGRMNKKTDKVKQVFHFDKENSEFRCGKKRKLGHNETEKMKVSETEQINTTKSKFKKLMERSQSKKNSCAINDKMSDTNSLKKYNYLQKENEQMKKLVQSKNSAEKDDRTIYIGNLPLKYDHKKVVKLFSKFGKIENARIRCVPVPSFGFPKRKAAITKTFHANRNSISAYVVFEDKESVSKAVELNGMVIDEHHLRIDKAVPQKKDLKKSVFVGGLPFDIEDDELWNFFKDCGEIDSVRVVRDNKFSMGKGFGYVNFKSSASVELALALDSHEIKNRKINVQRCISKKKKENFKKLSPLKKEKKKRKKPYDKSISSKSDKKSSKYDFQGREAEYKQKRKKRKLTKDAERKSKIMSTLKLSLKKNKNGNKSKN